MFSRYGWLYSTETHLTTLKLTGIILFTSAISYHANKIRGNSRLKQTVLLDGPLTNTSSSRSPYRAQLQFTRISRRRLYIWIAIWSCDISRKSIHITYVSWAYHTKIACVSTDVLVKCRLDEILIHTSVRHRYTYLCFNTSIFQTAGRHGFVVRTDIQYSDSASGLDGDVSWNAEDVSPWMTQAHNTNNIESLIYVFHVIDGMLWFFALKTKPAANSILRVHRIESVLIVIFVTVWVSCIIKMTPWECYGVSNCRQLRLSLSWRHYPFLQNNYGKPTQS